MDDWGTLIDALRMRGETLAVAESFTGGLVMATIVDVAGASDVFLGGACTYSDESKTDVVGVPRSVLRRHGAVSRETASAMASGARKVFGADYGLSTTGIAGPTGATPGKRIGLAYVAAVRSGKSIVTRRNHNGDRASVRQAGVEQAFEVLRRLVSNE